jgi:hypothetical protein
MIVDLDKLYEGTGGPAYPYAVDQHDGCKLYHKGMSLRDWLAGQALTTVYANETNSDPDKVAEWAYQIADAMIAARKPKNQP